MRILAILLGAAAILAAAACSRVYPVRVTQLDGEIFMELRSRTDLSGREPPCVRTFGIMDPDGGSIWGADAPAGCATTSRFQYGEAPPGWKMSGPPPALQPGRRYQAMIGARDGFGLETFRYRGDGPGQ